MTSLSNKTRAATTQAPGLAHLLTVSVAEQSGILAARQRAREIAGMLGFEQQDQIRIATATSEMARNAAQYGREGRVEFFVDLHAEPSRLTIRVSDKGAGIQDPQAVLEGRYLSPTGMGMGLTGTQRLMDDFSLVSGPESGTVVTFSKACSAKVKRLDERQIAEFASQLARHNPSSPDETRQQEQELMAALELIRKQEAELAKKQADRLRIDQELEETNRGVVALYAELDERASALRTANEIKTRFLSYMSHEFRTPLNSILALSELLLRRVDGDLTSEQERQIKFVRAASNELLEMVNDLLDLAKVESGKVELRKGMVEVSRVFGALRGMMRPLIQSDQVNLVFEEPMAGLSLVSDEGKINQILRNLISNALKFTERGEVCVRVSCENQHLSFSVIDSGIGIAAQDQEKIFREFAQIENPVQRKIRGTGLGLPLSRKLAELLGGSLTVTSELGHGSTFVLTLPLSVADAEEWKAADDGDKGLVAPPSSQEAERENILVIDDDEVARYLVHQIFRGTPYLITEASGGVEGLERARFDQPSLILLDLAMPDRNGFEVLADLKSDPATRDIPVILHTSTTLTESDVKRLNSWHAGILSKETHDREKILAMIREMLRGTSVSH